MAMPEREFCRTAESRASEGARITAFGYLALRRGQLAPYRFAVRLLRVFPCSLRALLSVSLLGRLPAVVGRGGAEASVACELGGVVAVVDPEFDEDPGHQVRDGLGTEPEVAGDGLVAPASGDSIKDLAFAVGQLR